MFMRDITAHSFFAKLGLNHKIQWLLQSATLACYLALMCGKETDYRLCLFNRSAQQCLLKLGSIIQKISRTCMAAYLGTEILACQTPWWRGEREKCII